MEIGREVAIPYTISRDVATLSFMTGQCCARVAQGHALFPVPLAARHASGLR
jgi:hypothetical protein